MHSPPFILLFTTLIIYLTTNNYVLGSVDQIVGLSQKLSPLIIHTDLHIHKTTKDLVSTTCSQIPDPPTCEAALRSDPRSSTVADSEGLILIMIDVVQSRFSDSLRVVRTLTRKTHDPVTTRALRECIRLYGVVLDYSIGVAKNAVNLGDPKFGEQAMVDAGNEAEACRAGFPDDKAPAQLAGRTRTLRGVSNVAASLIKTLE